MAIQARERDPQAKETKETHRGTILSVTVVGVFFLLVYLVMFGLYMSRV